MAPYRHATSTRNGFAVGTAMRGGGSAVVRFGMVAMANVRVWGQSIGCLTADADADTDRANMLWYQLVRQLGFDYGVQPL